MPPPLNENKSQLLTELNQNNFFLPSHSCGAPTFRRDDSLLNGNLVLEHPVLKAWSLQAENLGIYADTLTVLDMVAWPVAMFEHNLRFLSGPN